LGAAQVFLNGKGLELPRRVFAKSTRGRPQEGEMKQIRHAFGLRLALVLTGVSAPSLKREEGQTFVEYALILAFISVLVIASLTFLKGRIVSIFSFIGNKL
jgi:Flp pilus assembly pilin Flp